MTGTIRSIQTLCRNKSCLISTSSICVLSRPPSFRDRNSRKCSFLEMKCEQLQKTWSPSRMISSGNIQMLKTTLKDKRQRKSSYIFEELIAEKVASSIQKNRVNPKAPILEIQAGPGVLSQEFIRQGVSTVAALETNEIFHDTLSDLQQRVGKDKFEYFDWPMLNLFMKLHDNSDDASHEAYKETEKLVQKKLKKFLAVKRGGPYSLFTVGGSQENHDFVFYVLRNMPNEDVILSHPGVDFFFIVHPKFKHSIESIIPTNRLSHFTRSYSYIHSLLCLLYDFIFIEEFNTNDFCPSFLKTAMKQKLDTSKRHLVRMQCKSNIHDILPFDQHLAFSIFLRHILRKKKSRIIPAMEMLVSGCGLHMLADGFTMMDTVYTVTPEDLLQLFKNMVTWPEYLVSPLRNHLLMRTQGGADEAGEMFSI